ncbi:hypothetical protein [Methanobrevibacter arboriphilus]|uniref:hypothetical protein n=1 Tax=Methanobrevibacter arboriphilus TaxID=39441 RepID=UPI000AA4850B|nr:hypothetical protein [Methanobrevibacter arboriphilus]
MKSGIVLRSEAMKILNKNIGKIDALKFTSSMKNRLDYIELRKTCGKGFKMKIMYFE